MKDEIIYCGHSGLKLTEVAVNAGDIRVFHYDSSGGSYWDLATKFNVESGEKNIAFLLECPKYVKKFFCQSNHTSFVLYNGERHYDFSINKS